MIIYIKNIAQDVVNYSYGGMTLIEHQSCEGRRVAYDITIPWGNKIFVHFNIDNNKLELSICKIAIPCTRSE